MIPSEIHKELTKEGRSIHSARSLTKRLAMEYLFNKMINLLVKEKYLTKKQGNDFKRWLP